MQVLGDYPATPWFVFLQDDAVVLENKRSTFLAELQNVTQTETSPVMKLHKSGNVALLFHRYYLQSFASYAMLRHDKMPIDWLLDSYNSHNLVKRVQLLHMQLLRSFGKRYLSYMQMEHSFWIQEKVS